MFVKGFIEQAMAMITSPCSNMKELLSAFETSEEPASERSDSISEMAQVGSDRVGGTWFWGKQGGFPGGRGLLHLIQEM